MLTLLLFIFLILSAFAFYKKQIPLGRVCCYMFILLGVAVVIFIAILAKNITIDEKIEMYTEESRIIEERINVAVAEYMAYEKDTYAEFKDDDGIAFLTIYPELKSDALVESQLNTYLQNQNKILELKESKIEASVFKFLLYFGR